VDQHESAISAGIREVAEETGLTIDGNSMSIICVFESTYPTLRMQSHASNYPAHPSNHDVIINYTARLTNHHQVPLFQPNEVDMAVWITPSQLGKHTPTNRKQLIVIEWYE
jgi:8-oxo-dGTP pyrophosphatase MutT (NUDIX family)